MMLSLYTANLTSILTVNRAKFPLNSIEDLLNHQDFTYGVENFEILENLFESSDYGPFQIMWNEMSKQREVSFLSHEEGIEKVRNHDNFAFIRESPYLEYDVTHAPCNLNYVISSESPKPGIGFAFAFRKNSTLMMDFSVGILNMFSNGEMASIHDKWFKTRSQCSQSKNINTSVSVIGFHEIRGIFYTFMAGLFLSAILFLIQRTKDKLRRLRRDRKISPTTAPPELEETENERPGPGMKTSKQKLIISSSCDLQKEIKQAAN